MPNRLLWRIAVLLVLSAGCAHIGQRGSSTSSTYSNPLPIKIADPFIYQERGTYYLYGTSASYGIHAWTSTDLVNWRQHRYVIRRTDDSWAEKNYWAPEMFTHRGKYYLHFTAARGEPLRRRIILAESDSPLGPFREIKAPWFPTEFNTIDSHVFRDNDGQLYLYYVELDRKPDHPTFEIHVRTLNDELESSKEATLCMKPTQKWEDGLVTEGPFVERRGDEYFMTYSGAGYLSLDYAVGIATSKSPMGPWAKSENNPILKRIPEISGPGHHCFAMSPDGKEKFIVYHVHQIPGIPSGRRLLSMDRVHFVDSDPPTMKVDGPTVTPQPMPSGSR